MIPDWRKPTTEEAARGFVAMHKESYYCQNGNKDRWPNGKILHETGYRWAGYTAKMIERRIQWGGTLPAWIEVKQPKRAA